MIDRNGNAAKTSHISQSIHRNLLQSEVVSFFTPAADKCKFNQKPVVPKPRRDIVEETKPQTKTIVLTNGLKHSINDTVDGFSVHLESNGENFRHKKHVAQICNSSDCELVENHSNSSIRSIHKQSSDSCKLESHLSTPDSLTNSTQPIIRDKNPAYPSQNLRKISARKSIFTSLIRRFSAPRNKAKVEEAVPENTAHVSNMESRGLRRWLTRRIWKPVRNVELEQVASATSDSQPSLASAGAILENNSFRDTFGRCSPEPSGSPTVTTHNFSSAPMPRKRSHLTASRALHRSNLPANCDSLKNVSADLVVSSAKSDVIVSDKFESVSPLVSDSITGTPIKTQFSKDSLTFVTSQSQTPFDDRFYFQHPTASSPLPSAIKRDSSIRSVDDSNNKRYIPYFSRNTSSSEANVLINRTGQSISLSEAKLPQSNRLSQIPTSPLRSCNYTPSYLSVSLAAFGYTGYNLSSTSAQNLVRSESPHPPNLPIIRSNLNRFRPPTNLNLRVEQSSISSSITNTNNMSSSQNKPTAYGNSESSPLVSDTLIENENEEPAPILRSSRPTSRLAKSTVQSAMGDTTDESSECIRTRRVRTSSHTANSDDQQHWHRSSLIMMAVAHASPRGRASTPTTAPVIQDVEDVHTGLHGDQTFAVVKVTRSSDGKYQSDYEKASVSIEPPKNIPSDSVIPMVVSTKISEPIDAATTATTATTSTTDNKHSESKIDGNYYLRQVDQTEWELWTKINETEMILKDTNIDDDVAGLLRSACGKAKLLISEKFCQFRDLCRQNLSWESKQNAHESDEQIKHDNPLITLISDLDGFWAMVSLQVEDVRTMFKQVDELKDNGWKLLNTSNENPIIFNDKLVKNTSVASAVKNQKLPRKSPNYHNQRKEKDSLAKTRARERLEQVKKEIRTKQRIDASNKPNPLIANRNNQEDIIFV